MSFVYGGINTDDLEGVNVSAPVYPNLGGLTLDTVDTPGRDGRYYGGSRTTTSVLSFRVTVRGENQQQADRRRLSLLQALDPSLGPRSLRLDNTEAWHYPEAVVSEQIEWEKHIDRSKVIYDGTVTFETNFDPALRQIDPSTVSGSGQIEFIADMGSTVSYPTVIFESGGDLRVRVNDFELDLHDTPPDTYGVLNWDEYKFYTADADVAQSILYEWEGEPHRSTSVYRVGGEIVARNLVVNPSFEDTSLVGWGMYPGYTATATSDHHDRMWGGVGSGSLLLTCRHATGDESNSWYFLTSASYRPEVVPGTWVAVAALLANDTPTEVDLRIQFLNSSGSTIYNSPNKYVSAPFYTGTREVKAVQVPEGAAKMRIVPWMRNSSPGKRLWVDDVIAVEADTEQEALAQVEHYFDGDSVGHIVPGERISSLVNHMDHYERPAIYPGQRVEVEVTPIGSNTATPVIIYPNHRRL